MDGDASAAVLREWALSRRIPQPKVRAPDPTAEASELYKHRVPRPNDQALHLLPLLERTRVQMVEAPELFKHRVPQPDELRARTLVKERTLACANATAPMRI